ncbi:hypothetical protein Pflav_020950 [Phytohabitans flavus]|uniref:Sodium/calcium exchanger membrane region domain-containing protein n=1 Tax=Phytohabitans flavus TaxID=1076124 RepID=A0A6F8XPD2_9ACTN|nr:hypothetical protein [Phytohabitans flavus]BCB75685.1 hypothetical protein Pflav_020950 [Phytohabitans flavus]
MSRVLAALRSWTTLAPLVAAALLVGVWGRHPGVFLAVVVAIALAGAVITAVHHAEVVAHRVGEPLGSLVLAVPVTFIEVGLIITLMLSGGPETSALARDTVFAAFMITVNGILGLCLVLGAARSRLAVFNAEGTGAALATVATLATTCLVLPTFTVSRPSGVFTPAQLGFAAVASLLLYGLFVFTQNVRHRDFFLPVKGDGAQPDTHAPPRPAGRPSPAWDCCSSRWSASSAWPKSSPTPSRTGSTRSGCRTPSSAW